MQSDPIVKQDPESDSPASSVLASNNAETTNDSNQPPAQPAAVQNGATTAQQPPSKSDKPDKPRPHQCTTCGRSFARLEHLKRHERSHTKEKPFECPECTRCFARRDLLLRHQQKLHTSSATTRPRNGRRESVASVASNGRIRKSSAANVNVGGLGLLGHGGIRPRANTISHIDPGPLAFFDPHQAHINRMNALGLNMGNQMGMGPAQHMGFDPHAMQNGHGFHGHHAHGLPKLDTHVANTDLSNSLHTAPPYVNFGGFDVDQLFTPNTTVNPAALHFGEATHVPSQNMPFGFEQVPVEEDYTWMHNWNLQTSLGQENGDHVLEESSPSRVSSGDSQGDYTESMNNSHVGLPLQSNFQWPQIPEGHHSTPLPQGSFQLGALHSGLPHMDPFTSTISPSVMTESAPAGDGFFQQSLLPPNPLQRHHSHEAVPRQSANMFGSPLTKFVSTPSVVGSTRQTHGTAESITHSTREALVSSLARPAYGGQLHRKFSQPHISSPLSPAGAQVAQADGPALPPTEDLVRYVEAFSQHALPHMPVVHMATLTFETVGLDFTGRAPSPTSSFLPGTDSKAAGYKCLLLGMAAIGALYEYDHAASKALYNGARKMISLFLAERRKVDMANAINGGPPATPTPMWLVEAMLLAVIYGHHCGDKLHADIANNHTAALVSLSRTAGLSRPDPKIDDESELKDVEMGEGDMDSAARQTEKLQKQWISWKEKEERKRVFYAIFILSSLLTTAYSQSPTIMNSEITLDLPCDELLWTAETAEEWQSRGGLAGAQASSIPFTVAMSKLLSAGQRGGRQFANGVPYSSDPLSALQEPNNGVEPDMKPSTFGCLVLINALHNFIWETRSRHHGRPWTLTETEAMVAHVEPALNAWQAAWKANEHHKVDRPNPFGLGPLASDSIPLLDLAFLRLYINFGRALEYFWTRDFDSMAEELRREAQPMYDGTPDRAGFNGPSNVDSKSPNHLQGRPPQTPQAEHAQMRRERHLRKAAFYAADSLTIACHYNLTYADATAHELPIQSAICFFDCAQVLAEWATSLQERVGRYMGVLGRDAIDYTQVPAVVVLQNEDIVLLQKIEHICNHMEGKRLQQESLLAMDMNAFNPGAGVAPMPTNVDLTMCGFGGKILRVTAMMLEKAVIWPVTHVMSQALECVANHMERRAEESCQQFA